MLLCRKWGRKPSAFASRNGLNLMLFDSKRERKWTQPAVIHEKRISEARVFLLDFIVSILKTVPTPFFIPLRAGANSSDNGTGIQSIWMGGGKGGPSHMVPTYSLGAHIGVLSSRGALTAHEGTHVDLVHEEAEGEFKK